MRPLRQETTCLVVPLAAAQATFFEVRMTLPPASVSAASLLLAYALPCGGALPAPVLFGDAAAVRRCLASAARCFPSLRAADGGAGASAAAAADADADASDADADADVSLAPAASAGAALAAAGVAADEAAALLAHYPACSFLLARVRAAGRACCSVRWAALHARAPGGGLMLPTRALLGAGDGGDGWPHALVVFSVGSSRHGRTSGAGGGKDAAQFYGDLRRRFATGSFTLLERAALAWPAARVQREHFPWPPEVERAFAPAHVVLAAAVEAPPAAAAAEQPSDERQRTLRFAQADDAGSDDDGGGGGGGGWLLLAAPAGAAAAARAAVPDVLRVRKGILLPPREDDIFLDVDERSLVQ